MSTPRPTPETDAHIKELQRNPEISGCNQTLDFARKLQRERDEAREELQQWKMLCAWGGTPEHIDQFIKGQQSRIHQAQDIEQTCEQLERDLDEALAKLSTVYRWIERNHSDGFIDSQSHLQNLDRIADAWHDKLEDMQRELGKTRDQLKAMREAIKEGYEALDWATSNMNPPFAWEPFKKANAALTKLQLFIAL